MTRQYWVRHGPTHEKAFVGWRDVPADLVDTAQIERLSNALPQDAYLVSSDLTRSVQTADVLERDRTRLAHRPGLREFNFGAWDGLRFNEVADAYPDLSRQYWEDPGDCAPPGGESWNAAALRVSSAADHLQQTTGDKPIIIVAHIGAILTQVQRALGGSAYEALGHKIDNLSVTELVMSGATPQVVRINHTP